MYKIVLTLAHESETPESETPDMETSDVEASKDGSNGTDNGNGNGNGRGLDAATQPGAEVIFDGGSRDIADTQTVVRDFIATLSNSLSREHTAFAEKIAGCLEKADIVTSDKIAADLCLLKEDIYRVLEEAEITRVFSGAYDETKVIEGEAKSVIDGVIDTVARNIKRH